jgi:hypothetical protein
MRSRRVNVNRILSPTAPFAGNLLLDPHNYVTDNLFNISRYWRAALRVIKGLLFCVALPIFIGFVVQAEMQSRRQTETLPHSGVYYLTALELGQDAASPLDDANWKLGFIYFNRSDPRVFVPKRFGVGNTVNFAKPAAWLFLAGIIALIAAVLFHKFFYYD